MSITEPPVCDHLLVAGLSRVAEIVTTLNQPDVVSFWQFSDKERLELTSRFLQVKAMLDAFGMQLLGALERDQVTERETGVRTSAWLRNQNHHSPLSARRDVATAVALTGGRFGATAAELAAGRISAEQAGAITRTLDQLPDDLSAEQVSAAEATILGFADTQDPRQLETCSRHLLNVIAPELAELKEAERLAREEREARKSRYRRMGNDGHGAVYGRFKLTSADGDQLRELIDAIAKGTTTSAGESIEPDVRTMEQKRADALMDLAVGTLRHGTAPAHGGDRPRVNLLLDYTALTTGLGEMVILESGQPVSADQARLLACDSDLLPIYRDENDGIVGVGTQHRFFDGPIRQALAVRDRGCAFPDCDVPARDCDAHHIIPWWHTRRTDLDNGVLLCRHHHQLVEPKDRRFTQEHEQWTIRMAADGIPDVIPPAHVDPYQQPRRHKRYPQRQ